jgi:hypothetical protein
VRRRLLAGLATSLAIGFCGCGIGVSEPARMIAADHATVDGSVFSSRSWGTIHAYFEWGETPSYGQLAGGGYITVGTPPSAYDLATKLRGLKAGTTYHYRVCATDEDNPGNPGCSADRTFTTPTTTGPFLTLLPQCLVLNGRTYDAVRVTASGLPPGDPGPPTVGTPIGYQVAVDGASFSNPGGTFRADPDGDIDYGVLGFPGDVAHFDVRLFTDPNFNNLPDPNEQILVTGGVASACSLSTAAQGKPVEQR